MQSIDEIKLYRYRIPCQTWGVLRKQPLVERQGFIIQLERSGKMGFGEIAPLPTFSAETLEMAEQQLKRWCQSPTQNMEDLYPSVAFGLSCALAELEGNLDEEGAFESALLCDGNMATFKAKLAQTGSSLAKIKIGFDAKQEGLLANRLLTEFPQLQLRLDANRAWQLDQAVEFAQQIAKPLRSRIQFIEEPCQIPSLSRQFAQLTGIAIAWDETVREADFCVKKEPYLSAIVIKPTLVGALAKCIDFIQQAHQQGLQVVISSSIESSLGLSQLARIAKQYTPESVAGLDTLHLMKVQLVRTWNGSSLPLVDLQSEFIEPIQFA